MIGRDTHAATQAGAEARAAGGRSFGGPARAADLLALAGFTAYAAAAPHSIAGAWIGLSFAVLGWLARTALTRQHGLRRTPLDLPLWLFFGWTALSCLLSYEPAVSVPKLLNVATFLIFYPAQSFLTRRRAIALAALMILSGAAGVVWGAAELAAGRGVVVLRLSADSPLRGATPLAAGDAVWRVNGRRVSSAAEIDEAVRATKAGERLRLSVVSRGEHAEWPGPLVTEEMRRAPAPSGVTGGGPTRRFRASGWTRHYETFAETIQIVAQLAFGFALAFWLRRVRGKRRQRAADAGDADDMDDAGDTRGADAAGARGDRLKFLLAAAACAVLAAGVALTAMRTAVVAFALGALVSAWRASPGRRARALVVCMVAIAVAAGALAVWRTRAGGALTLRDASANTRLEVARVAAGRVPLHPVFGHGMDAARLHWREWGFPGNAPLHTHSTFVQLAFDRGLPALAFWLWLMAAFWRTAARAERSLRRSTEAAPHGLALGVTGALTGFLASSLVNYNFGDAEVALLVWWMMAATLTLNGDDERTGMMNERE